MENRPNKRQYRELDDATKQKMSAAARGKHKSAMHRQHLSQALKDYWNSIPHRPSGTTMNDLIGG